MRSWAVILLTLVALAIGGGGGVVVGFLATAIHRVNVDLDAACLVLQKAETGRYLTKGQRAQLVDKVLPEHEKPDAQRERRIGSSNLPVQEWFYEWDQSQRSYVKSGCPGA